MTESFTSTFSVGLPDPCSDEETILIIEMEGHNAEDLQSKSFHLDVAEAIRLSAYIIFQYGEAARHFGVKLYRVGEKYPVFLMYTDSMGLQYFYYVAPTEGEYYFKIDSINADWSLNVFKCVNP
ncbi:hypothetical protein DRN93_03660 [archaeon]|nr:MAG: hypothetical protein DRN93_03660 [archaeon]